MVGISLLEPQIPMADISTQRTDDSCDVDAILSDLVSSTPSVTQQSDVSQNLLKNATRSSPLKERNNITIHNLNKELPRRKKYPKRLSRSHVEENADKENTSNLSAPSVEPPRKKRKMSRYNEGVDWKSVVIEGDKEDTFPMYDTPAEVRRKIEWLLDQPNFQITPWLDDIGPGAHRSNYTRFMAMTGEREGTKLMIYPLAYLYFEKLRIVENRPKSIRRILNEDEHELGFRTHTLIRAHKSV